MNHKETVKTGYNKIADRYLAERSRDAENVRLLNDFIELLAPRSKVLDAGCGAGIPITQMLVEHFDVIDFLLQHRSDVRHARPRFRLDVGTVSKSSSPLTERWRMPMSPTRPLATRAA